MRKLKNKLAAIIKDDDQFLSIVLLLQIVIATMFLFSSNVFAANTPVHAKKPVRMIAGG